MKYPFRSPWFELTLQGWALSAEAATVMGLRTARIAQGGMAAAVEAQLMITEKIEAALALQALAVGGALGTRPSTVVSRTLKHYGRKVRANRRRLSNS